MAGSSFAYRNDYFYTLLPNSKRQLRVEIHRRVRTICSETISGLTTRHTIIRAHRYARRYIKRLIKDREGCDKMSDMIRDIQPENVL